MVVHSQVTEDHDSTSRTSLWFEGSYTVSGLETLYGGFGIVYNVQIGSDLFLRPRLGLTTRGGIFDCTVMLNVELPLYTGVTLFKAFSDNIKQKSHGNTDKGYSIVTNSLPGMLYYTLGCRFYRQNTKAMALQISYPNRTGTPFISLIFFTDLVK